MTKVTYNMYSCSISGMSREMMKMDGRDSAKCQKSKLRDKITVAELFGFRKRISNFSLDLREIRPSEFFGLRRKAALRGEA